MAEMFPTRMRFSGVSLGYQVTAILRRIACADRRRQTAGSLRLGGADRDIPGGRGGDHPRGAGLRPRDQGYRLADVDSADAQRHGVVGTRATASA